MTARSSGRLLEEFVSSVNGNFFLREFTVSSARLGVPEGEIELADTMVVLRKLLLLYQLKERDPSADSSYVAVQKWFDKKVNGIAVGQIADTRRYLTQHAGRRVTNDRGHLVSLPSPTPTINGSLAIYRASALANFRGPKGRATSRAGFVHFIEASDYFRICDFLQTPVEILEYLTFREQSVRRFGNASTEVSERSLLGQFLTEASGEPSERFGEAFDHLVETNGDFDLSAIMHNLGDRIDHQSGEETETAYYSILQELALLSRTGLVALKTRLKLCVEVAKSGQFRNPTHFGNPTTDCGFLITPWDPAIEIPQQNYLRVLTQLSKYALQTRRHVGLSVSNIPDGFYIFWCFLDAEHVYDPDMEKELLRDGCPLPSTSPQNVPKYNFGAEGLNGLLRSDGDR